MLFMFMALSLGIVVIAFVATQIVLPVLTNKPLVPILRKNIREAALAEEESRADRVAAKLEADAERSAYETERIRNPGPQRRE